MWHENCAAPKLVYLPVKGELHPCDTRRNYNSQLVHIVVLAYYLTLSIMSTKLTLTSPSSSTVPN